MMNYANRAGQVIGTMTAPPEQLDEPEPGAAAERRLRRHVDAVAGGDVAVRATLREAYEESWQAVTDYLGTVEFRLRMVELEMDLAAATRRAQAAPDRHTFAAAIDDELAAWRLYLERLQARTANLTDERRTDAEQVIRELRLRYTALAARLGELRAAPAGAWRLRRAAVLAASRELERAIDGASASFD